MGFPSPGLVRAARNGWGYLQVQGVESGPFPKQGCVMYCQLEGASGGYLLAVLSLQQGLVFLHVS